MVYAPATQIAQKIIAGVWVLSRKSIVLSLRGKNPLLSALFSLHSIGRDEIALRP
jgi:hypothetical protein